MRDESSPGSASEAQTHDGVSSSQRPRTWREAYQPADGAALEARLKQWRHRRTDQDPQIGRARRRRWLVTVSALILVAVTAVSGLAVDHYSRAVEAEQTRTTQTADQAAALPQDPSEDRSLQERLTALSDAADQQSTTLAQQQNQYAQLLVDAATAGPGQNGVPSQATQAVIEHRKSVATTLNASEYRVPESSAYNAGSSAAFDSVTELDSRWPWYTRYDGREMAKPESWSWQVTSVAARTNQSVSGDRLGTADVVFTATDSSTGEVLAVAQAVYDHDGTEGRFTSVQVTNTVTGEEQANPQDEDSSEGQS